MNSKDSEASHRISHGISEENGDLMTAMLNITDVSVNLKESERYPAIFVDKTSAEVSKGSSGFKMPPSSCGLPKIVGSDESLKQSGTHREKVQSGIPELIKNAIAQTIKATESHRTESQMMTEDPDAQTEEEETSYFDNRSEISELEVLKNSDSLMNKYGALY